MATGSLLRSASTAFALIGVLVATGCSDSEPPDDAIEQQDGATPSTPRGAEEGLAPDDSMSEGNAMSEPETDVPDDAVEEVPRDGEDGSLPADEETQQ